MAAISESAAKPSLTMESGIGIGPLPDAGIRTRVLRMQQTSLRRMNRRHGTIGE
jgi:hypothetical protein